VHSSANLSFRFKPFSTSHMPTKCTSCVLVQHQKKIFMNSLHQQCNEKNSMQSSPKYEKKLLNKFVQLSSCLTVQVSSVCDGLLFSLVIFDSPEMNNNSNAHWTGAHAGDLQPLILKPDLSQHSNSNSHTGSARTETGRFDMTSLEMQMCLPVARARRSFG